MKKLKTFLRTIALLAFVPWVQAATFDLTANEWDFAAEIFGGDIGGETFGFEGSTLLFETQVLDVASSNYLLTGNIEWEVDGSLLATSLISGIYDGADSIAFLANTDDSDGLWFLFQGIVDDVNGNFMVGIVEGTFTSDINGYWYANKGVTREGEIPAIALPSSALFLLSALGIGFAMIRTT